MPSPMPRAKLSYAGLFACLVWVSACGIRTEEELARTSSPDKRIVATVVRVDPGGGATVGFTIDVYVNEAGEVNRKHPQFEGYSCGPVSAVWQDNQILQITYWSGCHIYTFDNKWRTGKGIDSLRVVELVLNRESVPK
jgi:hypothetical protein